METQREIVKPFMGQRNNKTVLCQFTLVHYPSIQLYISPIYIRVYLQKAEYTQYSYNVVCALQ